MASYSNEIIMKFSKLPLDFGHYLDSNDRFELVNQQLQSLPTDEVRGLLVGEAGKLPNVYLLPFTVSLEKPGCLQVDAYVFWEGDSRAIYSGQVIVTVK